MITTCLTCRVTYDDAEQFTICPHRLLLPVADMERKKEALALSGKRIRFAHMPEDAEVRITSICWNGMVTLEGFAGEFAPHLFVVVE